MRVAELWRFPVKSLQGERINIAEVGPLGLVGDRRWAIFDVSTGFGLTARRAPELLFASARLQGSGAEITLPDGTAAKDDEALSAWLGRSVHLRETGDMSPPRYENPRDIETEAPESWHPFEGRTGAFHDACALTLLSRPTMRDWATSRFRADIIIDTAGEDDLIGSAVRVGTALLHPAEGVPRCVMVTRAQPEGIEIDRDVLRCIHRERGGRLAVGAEVAQAGTVRVGDEVTAA